MTTFTLKASPHLAGHLIAVLTATVIAQPKTSNPTALAHPRPTAGRRPRQPSSRNGPGDIATETRPPRPRRRLHPRRRHPHPRHRRRTPRPHRLHPSPHPRRQRPTRQRQPPPPPPHHRQQRVVKERDRECINCGRDQLLEYNHNPPYDRPTTPSPTNSNSAAHPATTGDTPTSERRPTTRRRPLQPWRRGDPRRRPTPRTVLPDAARLE